MVGTAVALVFWHIPGFITLIANPKKVLCENDITRASSSHRLCAAQGSDPIGLTHFRIHLCLLDTRSGI